MLLLLSRRRTFNRAKLTIFDCSMQFSLFPAHFSSSFRCLFFVSFEVTVNDYHSEWNNEKEGLIFFFALRLSIFTFHRRLLLAPNKCSARFGFHSNASQSESASSSSLPSPSSSWPTKETNACVRETDVKRDFKIVPLPSKTMHCTKSSTLHTNIYIKPIKWK